MTFPSLSSERTNSPPSDSALARERSISSGDALVSSTSSRGIDWIPILTSTVLLSVLVLGTAGLGTAGLGTTGLGTAGLGAAVFTRPWPAADPPPRQPGYELLGGVLGDLMARAEPEGGTGLGHADQP